MFVAVILAALAPAAAGAAPPQTSVSTNLGVPQPPTVTVTFVASPSGGETFACSLDGSAYAPCTSPYVSPSLVNGQHVFSVAATVGGETDPTPAERIFCVCETIPGSDRPGVSINDGARYTNDRNVSIRATPLAQPFLGPTGSAATGRVLISNDGGFKPSSTVALSPNAAWKLDSSGPERLPKTVYLRFSHWNGYPASDSSAVWIDCCIEKTFEPTYQDDIILDETNPTIQSASFAGGGAGASGASAIASARRGVVRIKAKDKTSGVKRAQFAKSGKFARKCKRARKGKGKCKGRSKLLRLKRKQARYRGSKPAYVRVQDGAGNFSRWYRLR